MDQLFTDDHRYADIDQIDPSDPQMVDYWARRWGVSSENILAAVCAVGTSLANVAPEIWKLI
jgi:hypothetical protein